MKWDCAERPSEAAGGWGVKGKTLDGEVDVTGC